MLLQYKNEQLNLNNSEFSIITIFEKIDETIKENDVIFSHLIIDGREVYENHEEYMKNRINSISNIEIVTRSTSEMILETMETIYDYLERAVPSLKVIIDESYERFSDKTWTGIDQLAEGMQWILQFATFTKNTQQPSHWDNIEKSIKECEVGFTQLIDAIEDNDTVLIIDILSYELTPAFESLQKYLEMSLRDKEYLNNAN
ncbi:hypothetical protein SAMN05216389_10567 [Oceanobacillus limi]|uniref:Uncharacterized protein n=1 Tax=Oceanobacillus limi TaxID=930131 RepID=A0A1I0BMI3_9BACI|nr:hypothetical protein [Oceanobacillus limi]SET07494.1 hypothetical protein SAMN05216389_10567 [Oceanobacillus limi]